MRPAIGASRPTANSFKSKWRSAACAGTQLDPVKVVVTSEVKNPELSKVDEVGLVTLAPGGGHGIAGSANFSTVELFAKAVPR